MQNLDEPTIKIGFDTQDYLPTVPMMQHEQTSADVYNKPN